MAVPILPPPNHFWYCPACHFEDVTHELAPHTRFHPCVKFGLMSVPMVPKGTKAKLEVAEREDYIGREVVQLAPETGRPIMNATITRDEGTDVAVYAPTATAKID